MPYTVVHRKQRPHRCEQPPEEEFSEGDMIKCDECQQHFILKWEMDAGVGWYRTKSPEIPPQNQESFYGSRCITHGRFCTGHD